MSEHHPTTPAPPTKPAKPSKPYPDFPLFPHAAGVWAKKIRGKMHYFGPWDDPQSALAKYNEQRDALHAGKRPRPDPDAVNVKDVCNAFLAAKQELVDVGELAPRTWIDYKGACEQVVAAFGKTRLVADLGPADFASLRNQVAKKWGLHRLAKTIQCVRSLFKYAWDAEMVDRPVRFGAGFKRPTKKTFRLHRAEQGPMLFSADELCRILATANPQLRAMVLLGVNCGYGNADVGTLSQSALDMERGWADYPRPKTGMPRRCPLWPETVKAIREAMAVRVQPKKDQHAGLVFTTSRGGCWHTGTNECPLSHEVRKLLKRLGINGHRNFYCLRHTFRTIADGAKDQPAADFIMGHETQHMSSVYRETISDERLQAVSDHVRRWLFAEPSPKSSPPVNAGSAQKEDAPMALAAAWQSV